MRRDRVLQIDGDGVQMRSSATKCHRHGENLNSQPLLLRKSVEEEEDTEEEDDDEEDDEGDDEEEDDDEEEARKYYHLDECCKAGGPSVRMSKTVCWKLVAILNFLILRRRSELLNRIICME